MRNSGEKESISQKRFAGFKTTIQTVQIEEMVRKLRIDMKERRKEVEVILKPVEYLKHMESIREQLRK